MSPAEEIPHVVAGDGTRHRHRDHQESARAVVQRAGSVSDPAVISMMRPGKGMPMASTIAPQEHDGEEMFPGPRVDEREHWPSPRGQNAGSVPGSSRGHGLRLEEWPRSSSTAGARPLLAG